MTPEKQKSILVFVV